MVMTQWDIVGGEFVASAVKATQYRRIRWMKLHLLVAAM